MKYQSFIKFFLPVIFVVLSVNWSTAQYRADDLYVFYQNIFTQHEKKLNDFMIDKLEQYLQNFPTSDSAAAAAYLLANVYQEKGKKYNAFAVYLKTLFLYPEDKKFEEYKSAAVDFVTVENPFKDKQEKLLNVLNGAFPINTAADRYHAWLAFLIDLDESNLFEYTQSGISCFNLLFPQDPRLDEVLNWDADLYVKRGKNYEASVSYLELSTLFPKSPLIPYAHLNRGILLSQKMDQPEEALLVFSEVVTNYPNSEYASESLFESAKIKTEKLKTFEDAIVDYRKLVTDYPQSKLAVDALMAISRIYSRDLKDFPAAIAIYEEIVEKYRSSPLGVDALEAIGNIYQDQIKDFDKAAEYYAKVAEIHPAAEKAPELLLKAGSVCENKQQNYEKAIEYYQQVIDKYPNHKKSEEAQKRISKARNKASK